MYCVGNEGHSSDTDYVLPFVPENHKEVTVAHFNVHFLSLLCVCLNIVSMTTDIGAS